MIEVFVIIAVIVGMYWSHNFSITVEKDKAFRPHLPEILACAVFDFVNMESNLTPAMRNILESELEKKNSRWQGPLGDIKNFIIYQGWTGPIKIFYDGPRQEILLYEFFQILG